jgi:single-stranded DNA-binding protein
MIDALISGKLKGIPEQRTGQSGKPFTLAKLIAHDGEVNQLVSVIAFDAAAQSTLLALGDGDSVALTGSLKVGTYTGKDGSSKTSLSLTAAAALTPYAMTKKRDKFTSGNATQQARHQTKPMPDNFDVDLPWGER